MFRIARKAKLVQAMLDNLGSAVVLFGNDEMLRGFNTEAEKLLELTDDYIGVLDKDMFVEGRFNISAAELEDDSVYEVEIPSNVSMQYFNVDYKTVIDKTEKIIGTMFIFHDISYIKELYNKLERSSYFDSVTGLPNKKAFEEKITDIDVPENYPLCIAVMNINGLKLSNAIMGMRIGDQMVRFTTEVLKTQMRNEDYAARLDGETVLLMPKTFEPQCVRLMKRVQEIVGIQDEFQMPLTVEFGVFCKTTEDEGSVHEILTEARNSMYRKKMLDDDSPRSLVVKSLNSNSEDMSISAYGHRQRVKHLVTHVCEKMGLSDEELGEIQLLAMVHDIGMIGVSDRIIKKEGSLDNEEWYDIKQHPQKGYTIANITPEMSSIASFILAIHERWDGLGYPNGLKGEEIPLLSRIVAVADAYDVMIHDSFYRAARSIDETLKELENCSGNQFDPHVVEVFTEIIREHGIAATGEGSMMAEPS